jgi:hypothetical protein
MKKFNQFILFATSISIPFLSANGAVGPCDIYADAKTPCVAAHSTVRALFGSYTGNLYQVRRADGTTKDVPVEKTGGYAKISVQDDFCSGQPAPYPFFMIKPPTTTILPNRPRPVGFQMAAKKQMRVPAQIVANGHKVHGIYRTAYSNIAYRNNSTTGIATGNEAESMYMVVDERITTIYAAMTTVMPKQQK